MCVHALHTVHALPDLRTAAGRLRDGCSRRISITSEMFSGIAEWLSLRQEKLTPQLHNLGD